jgi:thiosulfate/3-mercaptopyruvate sulfurtransferase
MLTKQTGLKAAIRSLLVVGAITSAAPAIAQNAAARKAMLVSADWLKQHASDSNLVLLHVGEQAEYDAAHIPGARLLPSNALSTGMGGADALALEIPSADELRRQLEALGVNDASRVVVYSGGAFPSATRVVFTLQQAGFGDRVSLLDGGLSEWKRAAYPTTTVAPAIKPGKLSPLKIQKLVVDADYVKQHLNAPGYKVVDARAAMFYDGIQGGGGNGETHPKGHIPGAVNVPFTSVVGVDTKLKSAEDLAAAFKAAGVQPTDKLMVYCHVGWQGTAIVFAARSLGIDAALYDGSFQDWSRRDLPVQTPAAAQ